MTGARLDQLYAKAHQAHAAGQFAAARGFGKEMEALAPNDPRAWIVLAQSALGLRDFTEAAKYLTALHEKDPENAGFRQQLTEIYRRVGYFEEAVQMFRPVFEKSQEVLEKYTYFGHLCALGGAEEEALKCFKKADEMSPDNADIKTALAKINIGLGDLKAAEKWILAALKINPGHIEALGLKGDVLKNLTASERKTLEDLLENPDGHLGQRVDAGFTLGKALGQETYYAATFEVYKKANELAGKLFAGQGAEYAPFHERAFFKKTISFYTPDLVAGFSDYKSAQPAPIFIIGLPRSGTTLVEQVLSSHKDIGAGGEMKLLGEFHLRLETLALENPNTPKADILKEVAGPWRQEYLALLKKKGGGKVKFVTDKMPLNFPFVGLAAVLFPKAKFIFLEREAMDNCLSMYFQPLTESYAATTSLPNLGDFYNLFQDYLGVWRGYKALHIHNLGYEDLARELEDEGKKLIDFLGLPWDQACLEFHSKAGAVRTLSTLQVREPVSAKYIGQWKNYEAHLGPLKTALKRGG